MSDATPYQTIIPFRDIDMHGHMHNAAHLSHFEAGLSHFLRAIGLQDHFGPGGDLMYHVRKTTVTFEAPTRYEDQIRISSAPIRLGRSSITFTGEMQGPDGVRATAEIVWVCVNRSSGKSQDIPDALRAKLTQHIRTADRPF